MDRVRKGSKVAVFLLHLCPLEGLFFASKRLANGMERMNKESPFREHDGRTGHIRFVTKFDGLDGSVMLKN